MPQSQGVLETLYLGSPVYSMTEINQNPKEAEPMPILLTSGDWAEHHPNWARASRVVWGLPLTHNLNHSRGNTFCSLSAYFRTSTYEFGGTQYSVYTKKRQRMKQRSVVHNYHQMHIILYSHLPKLRSWFVFSNTHNSSVLHLSYL